MAGHLLLLKSHATVRSGGDNEIERLKLVVSQVKWMKVDKQVQSMQPSGRGRMAPGPEKSHETIERHGPLYPSTVTARFPLFPVCPDPPKLEFQLLPVQMECPECRCSCGKGDDSWSRDQGRFWDKRIVLNA